MIFNDQGNDESSTVNTASPPAMPADAATDILDPSQVFIVDPYFSVTTDRVIVCVVFSVLLLEPVDHVGITSECAGAIKRKANKINFFRIFRMNGDNRSNYCALKSHNFFKNIF